MVYVRCDTINLLRLISLNPLPSLSDTLVMCVVIIIIIMLVIVIAVCVVETRRRCVMPQCHLAVKIATAASLASSVVAFTVDQFPFLTFNPFSVLVLAYTTYLVQTAAAWI